MTGPAGAPRITVDTRSGLAPWRQVHGQLTALIDASALRQGARLPAIRRLARDLGISPGTVARAYRELEAGGRVRTARGGGTVVAAPGAVAVPDGEPLRTAARGYLATVRAWGVGTEAALAAVQAAADEDGDASRTCSA